MNSAEPNIKIPVDLTNPGQFFACCGLLELADRLWPGAEGWFEDAVFCIATTHSLLLSDLCKVVSESRVINTMAPAQNARRQALSALSKKEREKQPGLEDEKKALEALRREEPIVFEGTIPFRIDWFHDDSAGGSRFKTWAGQQSVLDIAQAMHEGMKSIDDLDESTLWNTARGIGLPFNFDSDLGGQGSALDIGFSFDPLAASEATRIGGSCRPALELFCFIGLQRFRPREVRDDNRFVYTAWNQPLSPVVAAAVASNTVQLSPAPAYEFRLLYRTRYLKSFLPAQPFQGEGDE
jgi:CRISPR-associated protein Csb3